MSSTSRLLLLFLALMASWRPARAQTVYAAVWGHPAHVVGSSTLHSGLYRSSDAGRTWTHLGPENLKAFSMDAVDATRGRVLFIAAGNGVHRSLDSGRTWKIVTDWRVTEVLSVAVDQQSPERVYAATAFGLWMSDNGGETWSNPEGPFQRIYVAGLSTSRDSVIAIAHVDGDGSTVESLRRFVSSDRARTWLDRGSVVKSKRDTIDSIAVMDTIMIAGERIAATWGGGVYRREGGTWVPSGLEGRQVWSLVAKEY